MPPLSEAVLCKCGRAERRPAQRTCRLCHSEYMVAWRERMRLSGAHPRTFGQFSGVYFVQCDGFVKIGVSDDVRARFRQLSSASPYVLVPLGYVYGSPGHVDELEEGLHERFKEYRHRGEWFRLEPELLAFIHDHAGPWPGHGEDIA